MIRLSKFFVAWTWTRKAAVIPLLLGAAVALGPTLAHGQSASVEEYQVKAAYLYNFAKFVEWPSMAFSGETSPITIGLLANDSFTKVLERTVAGRTAQGRAVVIKRFRELSAEVAECQIVFVGSSQRGAAAEVLRQLNGNSVLTVSETDGFAQRGGTVNFVLEEKKVRFEVNNLRAKEAGIKVSSKLLTLATFVWE